MLEYDSLSAGGTEQGAIPLAQVKKWQSIRVVAVQKTYLYDSAEQQNKRKRDLVKGDVARINESRRDRAPFVYVTDNSHRISGWISHSDLFSNQLPAR